MMTETIRSSFSNQGEICLCSSRILIEESVYEKFKKEFVEKAKSLIIGDPLYEQQQPGSYCEAKFILIKLFVV
jgi:aminomuconate-semialdehyde/2-hydroxymuconate-6-semialdehyde dehydrogenase